jgi:2-amino-4-hydroxy-6-hydroxymethyldihydropteridine diphosphokinase
MGTKRAYISFGSNIGDRNGNIRMALELIGEHPNIEIERVSSIYETEPFGRKDQRWFLNGVVEITTSLSPEELLIELQDIEIRLGRKREERWGPRRIDLDIILFDNLIIEGEDLKIPHPGLHNRRFVLTPLVELAPRLLHPRLNKTIEELLLEVGDRCEVKMWQG